MSVVSSSDDVLSSNNALTNFKQAKDCFIRSWSSISSCVEDINDTIDYLKKLPKSAVEHVHGDVHIERQFVVSIERKLSSVYPIVKHCDQSLQEICTAFRLLRISVGQHVDSQHVSSLIVSDDESSGELSGELFPIDNESD